MSETFDKIVLGIALLLLVPVLLSPAGWLFAVTAAVLWVIAAYGIRWALGVEKARRTGERGRIKQVRADADRRDRR